MSSDWQAIGLANDPTPGDPEAVRSLATRLGLHATTAEGGTTRLRTIAAGGGDLAMQGDYAAGYTEALRDLPDQLAKLAKAYRGAGTALDTYATAWTPRPATTVPSPRCCRCCHPTGPTSCGRTTNSARTRSRPRLPAWRQCREA